MNKTEVIELQFSDMLTIIAGQTDQNNHTGAKITIASFFGLSKFKKIFQLIDQIHDIEGSMPYDLGKYRTSKGCEMMEVIKRLHGDEIYKKVYQSL